MLCLNVYILGTDMLSESVFERAVFVSFYKARLMWQDCLEVEIKMHIFERFCWTPGSLENEINILSLDFGPFIIVHL